MSTFKPKRLSLARMRRRLTAKALAEKTGLAPETIARLEKGSNVPDEDTISRLSSQLGYPDSFFFEEEPEDIDTDAVSFRSFSKMSARERDAAVAAGSLGLHLSRWVEERFTLPISDLLDMSHEENPEVAAASLRQYWTLGERPIGSVIALLETKGVRVFSLSENTATVNAFSFWRDDKPFVFLNNFKTAESSIFDTAHELGHLVMHKRLDMKGIRSVEREADRFASAFLMPSNDVKARLPRNITVDALLSLKSRWRVSAMALARRAYDLHRITEWQYKSICIELGRRGYRQGEPIGTMREASVIWKKLLVQLWSEKISKNSIAKDLHLPLDELEGLIWNLTGDDQRPDRTGPNKLRAVDQTET